MIMFTCLTIPSSSMDLPEHSQCLGMVRRCLRSRWGQRHTVATLTTFETGLPASTLWISQRGMIFDFISTGRKIGAIYERLLIPGLTDEETAFTYLIESPFSGVRTEPGKMHHYSVRLDAVKRRAVWQVDERPFFKAEGIPVELGEITLGFGLFTLKPIDPEKGSVSTHGQGATGIWKNFRYSVV